MAAMLRAYIDESGTHDGSPMMAIAGYVWRKPQVSRFSKKWSAILEAANEGKPSRARFFHMRNAGDPPTGEFRGWDYGDVDALARELIAQIKQRTMIGFGVTFKQADYDRLLAGRGGMPSAYAFGCFAILGMIRRWLTRENLTEKMAYYFESGHHDEENARQFLARTFSNPRHKTAYHHFSDQWVDKVSAPALQAADMLAWHSAKHQRNLEAQRKPRADFVELVRSDLDLKRHYEIEHLESLLAAIIEGELPDDPIPYVPRSRREAAKKGRTVPSE